MNFDFHKTLNFELAKFYNILKMTKVDGNSSQKEIELEEEGLGYDYVFKRLPEIR